MEKIRIGIIGTGGISNAHVRAYKKMEDVEIVAGADIIPGKAREALDRWEFPEAQAYEDTEKMLSEVKPDAVSVCTYNTAHAVCAAAAAGLALMLVRSGVGNSVEAVTIGTLMLLVPGISLTNAMREIMGGDVISGVNRMAEVILVATAIALGSALPMLVARGL